MDRATQGFFTVVLLIDTLSPMVLNDLWLMSANAANAGIQHQEIWRYALVFDCRCQSEVPVGE